MRNFLHFYGNGFLGADPVIKTNNNGKEFAILCVAVNSGMVDVPTDWLSFTTSRNLDFIKSLKAGNHISISGRLKNRRLKPGVSLIADVVAKINHRKHDEEEDEEWDASATVESSADHSKGQADAIEDVSRIPDDYNHLI